MCSCCEPLPDIVIEHRARLYAAKRLSDLGKGEADTVRRLRADKIPIDWKARLTLERGMRGKVRTIMQQMVHRVFNAELRAFHDKGRPTTQSAVAASFQEQIGSVIASYSRRAYVLGMQDQIKGIDSVLKRRKVKLHEAVNWDLYYTPPEAAIDATIGEFAVRQSKFISDTVANTAIDTIRRGIRDGLSVREIQELLKAKAEVALGRSEVIVRTCIVKASNLGRTDESKALGVEQMELVGCDPECEECQAVISGNPYPIDEVSAIEMGLHPNHTGSWLPIFKAEDLELRL